MEKRIFAAIAISIAFLWLWAAVAPRLFPELAKPKVAPKKVEAPVSSGAPRDLARRPAAEPAATPQVVVPVTPVAATTVTYTTVETPDFTARFSNRGAQLVSFQLKKYHAKNGDFVELVKARPMSRTDFPFALESADAALSRRLNSALYAVTERSERGATVIEYRYAGDDGVGATKTFRVSHEYMFDFAVSVTPRMPYRVMIGPGLRTLEPHEVDNRVIITGNGIVQRDGKLKMLPREKGDRILIFEQAEYIGVEDNYFMTALRPSKGGAAVLRRVDIHSGPKEMRKELYAGVNAAPDGTVGGSVFFGPKETKLLDRYGLGEALQYGMFGIIARFLLEALTFINKYTKNYGFAIIVLTILIKIVLYPLQHKSIVSMKKMQKVQPKMEAIKNKYKKARSDAEQRQKMNVEMMKLYQVEGINPMSGCIPIVLQLPILWGFYNLLSHAIELRGAPFLLWIRDLSEKDPYYITPVLMTITMFIQTWMTPSTGDPAQRRIFLIMPLVFGWIFKEFPSGLVLYWLVQNLLTIAQQMIMNKWWKDHPNELKSA